MVTIRHECTADIAARDTLLDRCFGQARMASTCERLRDGRLPADGLSFVAIERGRVVGTVRLWHVSIGPERPALLLGPLAVDPDHRNSGVGTALMERAIAEARCRGHREILLVGDAPYYARFGFSAARTAELALPGPFERHRLLALAVTLDVGAPPSGLVRAAGFAIADMPAIRQPQARKRSHLSRAA